MGQGTQGAPGRQASQGPAPGNKVPEEVSARRGRSVPGVRGSGGAASDSVGPSQVVQEEDQTLVAAALAHLDLLWFNLNQNNNAFYVLSPGGRVRRLF